MDSIRKFLLAMMVALFIQVPYMVYFGAGTFLMTLLAGPDSPLLLAIALYLGIGAWAVFVKLRLPSRQDLRRIDFPGAAKNIYVMTWWPWHLLQRRKKNGKTEHRK